MQFPLAYAADDHDKPDTIDTSCWHMPPPRTFFYVIFPSDALDGWLECVEMSVVGKLNLKFTTAKWSSDTHLPSTRSTLKCALDSVQFHAERSSKFLSLIVHVRLCDATQLSGKMWLELFDGNLNTTNRTCVACVTCCWRSRDLYWFFRANP